MRAPWRWGAAMTLVFCRPPEAAPPLPDVMVVHCRDIIDSPVGPVCELDSDGDRHIRLWMPGEMLVAWIDGERQDPVSQTAVDDGFRLEIEVPSGAGALTLARAGSRLPGWRLPFAWSMSTSRPALTQAIDAARAAHGAAHMSECRREAKRAFALAEAQHRGASAMLAAMMGVACSTAEPWHEWTAMAARIPAGADDRELDRASLEAQYFHREGALPQAIAAADRGLQAALRLGLEPQAIEFLNIKASVLAELGDFSDAIAVMDEWIGRDAIAKNYPCHRASMHINLAWALMQWAERDTTADQRSPYDALQRGLRSKCPDGVVTAFRLNLVRALQRDRRWDESGRELDALATRIKHDGDGAVRAEFQLLRARQSLAKGQAVAADEILGSASPHNDLPADLRLELTLARGEVEEALGSWRTAFEAYETARRITNDRIHDLPADGGMQRFLVDRLRGVQRLVELSRSRFADDGAAFRVAREAAGTEVRWLLTRATDPGRRREFLAGRDEAEQALVSAWDLGPSDRRSLLNAAERAAALKQATLLGGGRPYDPSRFVLRAAAPGELLLLYFPLDVHRWLAFAAAETGVETAVIDLELSPLPVGADVWSEAELAAWSERLLAPLAGAIDRARVIRVLPSFGVQALPFHALPWRGQPLLAHAEVAYSLDLPDLGERRTGTAEDRVLLVADPLGDLDGARRESAQLQASMSNSGVEVLSLTGQRATGPAVRASLSKAGHFHYAGHSASAGAFGWASTLRLAEDTSLSVADIVALDQVPATVVLVSCDAGHASRDPRAQSISLAAAFVFSGSDAVIAMSVPIDANEAPRLASVFHGRLADASSLAMMYRKGLLRLRGESLSDTAWQGLRLWVP